MSDVAPQHPGPNLHAIFGIDGEAAGDPTVEMLAADVPQVEQAPDQEAFDLDTPTAEHAPAQQLPDEPPEQAAPDGAGGEWKGITRPSRRGSSSRFLTDVIVDMGLCSRAQVDEAIASSRNTGTTPERVLLDTGALTRDGLARALAERYGLDHLDLGLFQVDPSAANLVSTAAAKRYQAVPVAFVDNHTLLVAMADPSNVLAVDDIAIMTGYEVRVAVAPPDDITALIRRLNRFDDVVADSDRERANRSRTAAPRSSTCTRPPTTRRSSSSSTRSSRRPSSAAPPTSISPPTGTRCACASASTASCRTSPRSRAAWPPASSRA